MPIKHSRVAGRVALAVVLALSGYAASAEDTPEMLAAMRATLPPVPTLVPSRDALPAEQRNALPEIKIDLLRWNEDSDQRLVIINGHRVEPGGVVGQELWLREIRADGVVMQFRDWFFVQPR